MPRENQSNSYETLHGATLDPSLIGPTLPPTPTFTVPIGPTGNTGPTGPTGAGSTYPAPPLGPASLPGSVTL
ncbi:exosporium leader peptide-containing protein [Bacillus mobilis]|uniref:exosporium leader peptide-containing protein n=1 Tax=Bacillus mobilis TaxID=2026190 RepID=UPI0036C38F28